MAAISWRALAGDVVTRRFCSASKSSRPLALTTSSPFISSGSAGCLVDQGLDRLGHVHDGAGFFVPMLAGLVLGLVRLVTGCGLWSPDA
jgi:hypothetical protein